MSKQGYSSSSRVQEKRVSGELFSLTYGAVVAQLVRDYESDEEINKQLDKMGYNIGIRLIEDFLARSQQGRCYDLKETADILAKVGFKTFLGVVPVVTNWSPRNDEFSLILDQNPLTDFVELPEDHPNLLFSNIMCGVVRGALEMVQLEVNVSFVQDSLRGDDTTELRVKFVKKLEDAVPAGDD
ncbi:trafficking protein particle complex subunit 3-like [Halichondria panicea]|uniref:trafficking protein particle complex subunit 3-like n=1 Tax=Halichondria panicea TaxID=6063 RepID=UPI00312B3264